MTQVKSRTKFGVAAVRILANGAADLPKAVEAQKGFHLMPLSAYLRSGLAYKPPEPRPLLALYESRAPEDIRFFDELGDAMRKRLPASADASDALVASFRQIGLSVGKGFEWQALDEPTKRHGPVQAPSVATTVLRHRSAWDQASLYRAPDAPPCGMPSRA